MVLKIFLSVLQKIVQTHGLVVAAKGQAEGVRPWPAPSQLPLLPCAVWPCPNTQKREISPHLYLFIFKSKKEKGVKGTRN